MDPFFISTTSCIVEGKCTMEGILEGDAVAYSYNEVISNIYERSGSMPRKLIMCGNHPVLAFEYDPESGRACSSGEVLDPHATALGIHHARQERTVRQKNRRMVEVPRYSLHARWYPPCTRIARRGVYRRTARPDLRAEPVGPILGQTRGRSSRMEGHQLLRQSLRRGVG